MALAVWLDYNHSVVEGKIKEGSILAQKWMRVLLCLAAIAFAVSIGWSRFVLGAHSMNQIIFGLLLGAWIACTFHFATYRNLMEQGQALASGEYFSSEKQAKFMKVTFVTGIIFAVLMIIQLGNYFLVMPSLNNPEYDASEAEWIA